MNGPLHYVRRLFDALYDATSNETTQHGVYANTRSSDGVYAITNTQSAESTYRAAAGADGDESADGAKQFDSPDSETSAAGQSIAATD